MYKRQAYRIANPGKRDCTQNLSGKPGNFAPELSAHLYANYFSSTSGGSELIYTLAANYVSEFNSSGLNDPLAEHEAVTKIDANVKIMINNGVEFKIFGRNITDEQVGTSSLALPLVTGSHFMLWEQGKEIGIALRKKFQ